MNRRTFLTALTTAELIPFAAAMDATDPALAKATQAVVDAIPVAEADPERPIYHFHPPSNWTNDPNGTIYYEGWHHLFYQLNPFDAQLGNQHWGHARSRDLVNWEHLPIAIWPSAELGEQAIFSGGAAFTKDGQPRLIYTSISQRQPEQWMAIPRDQELLVWEKYRGNPVLTQAAHGSNPIAQWRDPFMFQKDGATYMVCGGGTVRGKAQVQLYRATKPDLTEWKHLGPVFQGLEREIRSFECPNLFALDGTWVLIISSRGGCEYWVGDLDIVRMQFTPSAHGILDPGDSYASNISVDAQGRTLLWLWGRTNTPPGKGWGGVMTMPRVLSLGPDGYLRQQPAPEFTRLREAPRNFPAMALDKRTPLEAIRTDCAEIEAEFSGSGLFGLDLRTSQAGKAGITISVERGYLNVGNARAFIGNADRNVVRIFLDKRCVEVFANGGDAAVYKWFDAGPEDLGVNVFGVPPVSLGPGGKPSSPNRGSAAGAVPPPPNLGATPLYATSGRASHPPKLESLKIWGMRGAQFTLSRFKNVRGV